MIWVLQRGQTRVSFQEKTTESLFQQIFLQVPKPTGSCGDDDAGSEGGGGVTEPLNPRRRSRLEWLERSKCRDVISLSLCDLFDSLVPDSIQN